LANEVIVKGLASHPGFQRFALRSTEAVKRAVGHAERLGHEAAKSTVVAQMRESTTKLPHFFQALKEEFRKGFTFRK